MKVLGAKRVCVFKPMSWDNGGGRNGGSLGLPSLYVGVSTPAKQE